MHQKFRDRFLPAAWQRYGFAVALFLAALAVRLVFFPVEARLTFATFFPAVVLAVYLCGVWPGALAASLSAAAALFFFSPPYFSWQSDPASQFATLAFLLATALVGLIVHRLETATLRVADAHARLADSERLLSTVLAEQTDYVFRFDRAGRFLYANPAGRRAFGLTDDTLPGLTWHALVRPDEQPEVVERLRAFTPANPVVRTETRLPKLDEPDRWGEFVHHAQFDAQGQLVEVQTVGRDVTERRRLHKRLADLYDGAPCGYFSLDTAGTFVEMNATMLGWLGCDRDEVLGKLGPKDFLSAEDLAAFRQRFPAFLATGKVEPAELDLIGRHGAVRRVSMSATAVRDAEGRITHTNSVIYDITELARVRRELSAMYRQHDAMLDNELLGIIKLKDRRTTWHNRAMELMFGYDAAELAGAPSRLLYKDDASYEALGQAAYPVLMAGGTYRTQLQFRRKNGSLLWVDMSGVLLSRETGESMWMMLDIDAMKQEHGRTEAIAYHDALTGLPNRLLLLDRLNAAIPVAVRMQALLAVCFIDLDGFKGVNDRLGHGAGDQLLKEVGRRLQACVRGNDTVARLGGDEFVLVLTHLEHRGECDQVLDRVIAAIRLPVTLAGGDLAQVSASIGVAYCPNDGTEAAQLLQLADEAMYEAKRKRA